MNKPYKFRSLPCFVRNTELTWCVTGWYIGPKGVEGGVLEWCYDKEDAERVKARMEASSSKFEELNVCEWKLHD